MRQLFLTMCILFCWSDLSAKDTKAQFLHFGNPISTAQGILVNPGTTSALALVRRATVETIASSPGCGIYVTISYDRSQIGFKLIDGNGLQTPAVMDLQTMEIRRLHKPGKRAGQVSFTRDGGVAFTVGTDLIVSRGAHVEAYNLGSLSNVAPISPDGNSVLFNDEEDQLWIMTLQSGARSRITEPKIGYFNPKWSPDGRHVLYSGLNGFMFVYDPSTQKSVMLGEGYAPSWSNNSGWVIYYKKEIRNVELVNSDIYMSRCDGTVTRRLTKTPDLFEMDPVFLENDSSIGFCSSNRQELYSAEISQDGTRLENTRVIAGQEEFSTLSARSLTESAYGTGSPGAITFNFEMPYINQVYDTPDWFNGNAACGPTSAMTVLAYYSILPRWDSWCSWPSGHVSPWGRFICETYAFRARVYSTTASDPNGTPAAGAYGFMWSGSNHPYSMMATYYVFHNIPAATADAPPNSTAMAEITSGYPYTMCVGLTSAGHIVVGHGIGTDSRTIIVNDPYGNKNVPGYPNYYGKNAQYDWPGYNNGNQNFQQVYWCTSSHGALAVAADSLVDDLGFENGFTLNTNAPASMNLWKDMNRGYNGHLWYTYTRGSGASDTCFATWRPDLSAGGVYEVYAYIDTGIAKSARYRVYHAGGADTVFLNQSAFVHSWVSLGRYRFNKGNAGYVILGDAFGVKGQPIVFDAMKWRFIEATDVASNGSSSLPEGYWLSQNYPNPFNPTSEIRYRVSEFGHVRLSIYDVLGREVAVLVNAQQQAGTYTVPFDARLSGGEGSRLSSGVYFYVLETYSSLGTRVYSSVKKLILLQ